MDRVKKLAQLKGERAFEAFADLMGPITRMAEDGETLDFFNNLPKSRMARAAAAFKMAKRNEREFLEIEAVKRGVSPESLKGKLTMDDIFTGCTELMNDPLFLCFFALAHRDAVETASTSAPDPTEAPAD